MENYNLSVSRVEPPLPPRGRCRGMRWFKSLQSSASLHLFSFSFRSVNAKACALPTNWLTWKRLTWGCSRFVLFSTNLSCIAKREWIHPCAWSFMCRMLAQPLCSNSTTLLSHLSPPGMRWLKSLQPLCLSSPLLFFVSFSQCQNCRFTHELFDVKEADLGVFPFCFVFYQRLM